MLNAFLQIFTLTIKPIDKKKKKKKTTGMICLKAEEAPWSLIFAIWPCQQESLCTAGCIQKLRQMTDLLYVYASNSWVRRFCCGPLGWDPASSQTSLNPKFHHRWSDLCRKLERGEVAVRRLLCPPANPLLINQSHCRFQTADGETLPIQLSIGSFSSDDSALVTSAGSQSSNSEKEWFYF